MAITYLTYIVSLTRAHLAAFKTSDAKEPTSQGKNTKPLKTNPETFGLMSLGALLFYILVTLLDENV